MNSHIRSAVQLSVAISFFMILLSPFLYSQEQNQEAQRQVQEPPSQAPVAQRIDEGHDGLVIQARQSAEDDVFEFSRRKPSPIDREFSDAVPAFRSVVMGCRNAVKAGQPIQQFLRDMDRLLVTFKAYFKDAGMPASLPDKTQFKDLSRTEIISATLTSAENLDARLQQAAEMIRDADRSNSVSIDAMVFLSNLHSEILRLELLRSKLK